MQSESNIPKKPFCNKMESRRRSLQMASLAISALILTLGSFSLKSFVIASLLLIYTFALRVLVDQFKRNNLTEIKDEGIGFEEFGLDIKKGFVKWSRIDIVELKIFGEGNKMRKVGELITTLKDGKVFKVTTHKPYDLAQSIYQLLHNNPQPNQLPIFNIC